MSIMLHAVNFITGLSAKKVMTLSLILFGLIYTPVNYLFAINSCSTIRNIERDTSPPDSLPTIDDVAFVEVPNYMNPKTKRKLIKEVKWKLSDVKQKNKKHRWKKFWQELGIVSASIAALGVIAFLFYACIKWEICPYDDD